MAEKKTKTTLDKIEKLIVDGQKEVLERIDKVEGRLEGVEGRLEGVEGRLEGVEGRLEGVEGKGAVLDKKLDAVHVSLKKEINTTAKMLDYDIKEVDRKLAEHMRVPHAV